MTDKVLTQEETAELLNLMVSADRETSVPPTPEMSDLNTIESLVATKKQNDSAIVGLADSLQARLNLLNEAVKATKPPDCKNCPQQAKVKEASNTIDQLLDESDDLRRTNAHLQRLNEAKSTSGKTGCWVTVIIYFIVLLIGIAFGQYTNEWQHQKQEPPIPTVQPATETLDEFAARESQVLTADERRKLIAATEIVLNGQYSMPHEIREAFRYERLKADVDSPAFKMFSDKWAAKVEKMQIANDTDAMRSVYESLLRGLKVQAYSDFDKSFSGEPVEGFYDVSPSIIIPLTTNGSEPVPPGFEKTAPQQRFFRRR